jgi:hypothetical protein
LLSICLLILLGFTHSLAWLASAEGSRTLYPDGIGGHRANIEWRTSDYGDFLRRRSLFKLYAQAGEVILLGSSAVGVNEGDILLYHPGRVTGRVGAEDIPDTPDFSCEQQRQATGSPDQGRITSRVMELAGPDTITDTVTAARGNAVPDGFVPCFYLAPETGIYHVVFYGPLGPNSDDEILPTGEIDLTSPENFNEVQSTSTAAWDVTVRSDLASTTDINGRLFVDYLTQFTGGNPRPVYSTIYVVTRDGYRYQLDLRGLDPDGFILYANDLGFLDSDGSPLYHDVVSSLQGRPGDQLGDLLGGVRLAPPTHLLFFNQPEEEALEANGIALNPTEPRLEFLSFSGRLSDNDTYVGGGGTFTFSSNVRGVYQLIISRDGVDFDPDNPLNRLLRRVHEPGAQAIEWNGLDNTGQPFPSGEGYPARLIVRGGEDHFPILDAEGSLDGGPTFTLLNPPNGDCPSFDGQPPNCQVGFYDDRGYMTADGEQVGEPGQILPGIAPPEQSHSNMLTGFDTSSGQRRFGDGSGVGFGDKKGLDLWTYFPSQALTTLIDIYPVNVSISKTDGGITTAPGGVVPYTLSYANTTAVLVTGVVISETVPLYTTFNQAASAPTQWSCPDGSPAGTACTTFIGELPGGAGGAVTFAVTVLESLPDKVQQIDNLAVIAEDGSRGPEPLDDNSAADNTPLNRPKDGDGGDGGDDDDDDDGDGGDDSGSRAAPPALPPATPVPTPLPTPTAPPPLPVLLLPETGGK